MKHTPQRKAPKPKTPVTLGNARSRVKLTQLQLEELSGVDRTRISKLESEPDPGLLHNTFVKLDAALRALGALRSNEQLVFGQERVSA